jgi:membrane associated rhomboid family serine protease
LLVGFLYGGTLLWGVLPISQAISWDGHLFGAVAGGILALLFPTQQDNRDCESPIDLLKRRGFDV